MQTPRPGILLVGNFLSSHVGTRTACEDLSLQLSAAGWSTLETSHLSRRVPRLLDMIYTTLVRRYDYKVAYVEVYSGPAFLWAEVAVHLLRLLRKPVILDLHGGALVSFSEKRHGRMKRLFQQAHAVVTPSRFLQAGLALDCPDIRYLPNGIDIQRYPFRLRPVLSPRLVWMRAFHTMYEPGLAVKALALLVDDLAEVQLTMIGPDKHDGSLASTIALAERMAVRSRLSITGPIDKSEVPERLADGDIFLNTTRLESFGVAVLEAAALGLPIVTTDVGELPLLWNNGQDALLVRSGDASAIAQAVLRLMVEPGLAVRLSLSARQKAERFDWKYVLPQWDTLLQSVLRDD